MMKPLNFGSSRPNVYTEIADRLIRELVKLGVPPPPHTKLVQAIVEGIDYEFLRYGFALAGRVDLRRDWHLIRWLEPANRLNIQEYECSVLPTLAKAITYVVDELDTASVLPTLITAKGSAITISSSEGDIVEISPVPLEPSNRKAQARYRRAFEGVSRSGDRARARKAMLSVPGYKALDANSDESLRLLPEWIGELEVKQAPSGGPLVFSPKTLVRAFQDVLQSLSIRIRNAVLLEVTARAFGAPSWNVVVAADELTPCCSMPTHVRITDTSTGKVTDRFYACCWQALPAFINECAEINRLTPLSAPIIGASSMGGMISIDAVTVDGRKKAIKSIRSASYFSPERVASLSCAEVAVEADEVPRVVQRALVHKDGVACGLSEMFQVDAPSDTQGTSALRRRGYKPGDIWRWRNYLLLVARGDPHSNYLTVEDSGSVGRKRKVGGAACYKAELARVREGVWVLLSDYGRNAEAVFNGMTDSEAKSIAKFAGIELHQHLIPPKKSLRSKLLAAGVEDSAALRSFQPVWSVAEMPEVANALQQLRRGIAEGEPLIFDGSITVSGEDAQRLTVVVDATNDRWLRWLDSEQLGLERHLFQFLADAAKELDNVK